MFLLTKFRELKNGAYGLQGLPWKTALLTAFAHDWIGLRIKLGGEWPTIQGAMYWFKHKTCLRDTAEMKQIMRMGGNEAVGIAYKLVEVGAFHVDDANEFSTVVEFDPLQKNLLAAEVIGAIEDDAFGQRNATGKDLDPYLELFDEAGLITRKTRTEQGTVRGKDGKRVPCPIEVEVIDFKILNDCVDDYTARSRRKAERQAKKKRAA